LLQLPAGRCAGDRVDQEEPHTAFDAAGRQVATGEAGGAAGKLPPGEYEVVVKAGAIEIITPRMRQ
jgi:hypothetical protein